MGRRMVEYERETKAAEERKRLKTMIAQESAETSMSAYNKATGGSASVEDMQKQAREGSTGSLSSVNDFRGIDNYWTNKLGEFHANKVKPEAQAAVPDEPMVNPYMGDKPGMDASEPAVENTTSSDALLRAKAYINKTSPNLNKY